MYEVIYIVLDTIIVSLVQVLSRSHFLTHSSIRLLSYSQKLNSSTRSAATANVLKEFLPVLDRLQDLGAKYSEDSFGKQYNALPGAMKAAMTDMGVVPMQVKEGDAIDLYQMEVVSSEHSDAAPKQTVLRVEAQGLELDGNVMRKPKVVASLGPEPSEAPAADAVEESANAPEASTAAAEDCE
jgi:hypothetical protein